MEIMPSEYQQLELGRNEKLFTHYAEASENFGFYLLNTNAAMVQGEQQHILICDKGVLMIKFFEGFNDLSLFETVMSVYYSGVFQGTYDIVRKKLESNRALIGVDKKLAIGFNYICVFPNLENPDLSDFKDGFRSFVEKHCAFKKDFTDFKKDFYLTAIKYIEINSNLLSRDGMLVDEKSVNSVLQRIAPEYTTIRISQIDDAVTCKGADDEVLVVTSDDVAVRAFMLDTDQINIVNKISKGDQLILACAGSGKSVILMVCNPFRSFGDHEERTVGTFGYHIPGVFSPFICIGMKEIG